jgi:Spy/CpxP family protein refolding chaperone
MKATILMITALFISVGSFAQDDELEGRGGKNADKLKQELKLDDAQYQKVKAINEKYADKLEAAKKDATKSKGSFKALKDQREAEINTVLTKEQQAQWEARRAENKEMHREHKEFRKELNFTEKQKADVKAINDNFKTQKEAVDAEKLTREAREQKMKALKEERKTKLKGVLTPEQYEMLKEEKQERKHDHKDGHDGKHKERK